MRIAAVRSRRVRLALTRPYAVSGGSWDHAEMVFVELRDENGVRGFGQASPAEEVTAETIAASEHALAPRRLGWMLDREVGDESPAELASFASTPAARAALDMALLDLRGAREGRAVVELLGRKLVAMPTSVTIGLKSVDETLAEAREYLARGLCALKVKTGEQVELDLERLRKLREAFGDRVTLRVDANGGYDERAFTRFTAQVEALDVELFEQPTARGNEECWRSTAERVRRRIVADESVHDEHELRRWIAAGPPFGAVNIKLMKCGGPRPALELAKLCERAELDVMWGCMDESVLGIAAALHAAFASRATRYLDLDGSFDLADDPFSGGFTLAGAVMSTSVASGLGVTLATDIFR